MKVSELRQILSHYRPEDHVAVALWTETDVIGYAENEMDDLMITTEQARVILDDIDRHQDSESGITWESIRWGIESLIEDEKEKREKENGIS